ncbi:MAG: hypothetical protein JM58_17555 [Peptococcaceae bacterium BICA1-8]|nr:MAG: hypothetical protein JM58_17555 [Peptococcaceae bacterium BICA1-8]
MGKIFIGLVHFPVYNKNMEIITTSITNLDIHDIARTTATYGIEKYYIIHPLETQAEIANEILQYWQEGYGSVYNPDRKTALEKVLIKENIEAVEEDIRKYYPQQIKSIVTDARVFSDSTSYFEMRKEISNNEDCNFLLLFGTGWGLAKEEVEKADFRLYPIWGAGEYNHLSVRSAVAIILDRLCGEKWW